VSSTITEILMPRNGSIDDFLRTKYRIGRMEIGGTLVRRGGEGNQVRLIGD
jgi:hypothetical protein